MPASRNLVRFVQLLAQCGELGQLGRFNGAAVGLGGALGIKAMLALQAFHLLDILLLSLRSRETGVRLFFPGVVLGFALDM